MNRAGTASLVTFAVLFLLAILVMGEVEYLRLVIGSAIAIVLIVGAIVAVNYLRKR